MIPSYEFMCLRDEILIQILGIDSSLPVYNSYWSEFDEIEVKLPYGGVLAKLGDFTYQIPLDEMDIGFDIESGATYRLYYQDDGLELDVSYHGDRPYTVMRYLYISNNSEVLLPSGLGIGTPKDDVINVYAPYILPDFRPMLTIEDVVALGSELNGIYFVIRDGCVYSIYVSTVREDCDYSSVFSTNSGVRLYPEWFYPDREYMEIVQANNH